jgi:hypothetical protein
MMRTQGILRSFAQLNAAAVLAFAASSEALGQDCGCYSSCNNSSSSAYCSGGSVSSCLSSCRINEGSKRQREALAETSAEEAKIIIPQFQAARDKLHATDPKSAQFEAVFTSYQDARRKRDNALLKDYLAHADLSAFLTNGVAFRLLDQKYLIPASAAEYFHAYALSTMSRMLDVGPALLGAHVAGAPSESMRDKGSYSAYVVRADEAEINVWTAAHGQPPVRLGLDGMPRRPRGLAPGEGKPLEELTPAERAHVKVCNDKANERYPGRSRGSSAKEKIDFLRACNESP